MGALIAAMTPSACVDFGLSCKKTAIKLRTRYAQTVTADASNPTDRQTNRQTNRPNQKHNLRN